MKVIQGLLVAYHTENMKPIYLIYSIPTPPINHTPKCRHLIRTQFNAGILFFKTDFSQVHEAVWSLSLIQTFPYPFSKVVMIWFAITRALILRDFILFYSDVIKAWYRVWQAKKDMTNSMGYSKSYQI